MNEQASPSPTPQLSSKTESIEKPSSRWPAFFLSIFVPGFGFARAGQWRLFITFFVGYYLLFSLLSLLATANWLPLFVALYHLQ